MKNRNLLLVLFVVLGLAAWFFTNRNNSSTLSKGNDFAIENAQQVVHKVFMADKGGQKVLIEKKNGQWLVNDTYNARPAALETLLETMERIRVREQVPVNAEKNVINEIAIEGIKAEFYDKNGKELKTVYIGGSAPGKLGTYAMLEGAKYPYVVDLGSWEGLLRPRFFLGELDWRDKTVFGYKDSQIKSVKVEYYQQPNSSFFLDREQNGFSVKAIRPDLAHVVPDKPLVEQKALYYVKGFERQIAEGFENDNPKRDSITQQIPFATIQVQTTGGESKKVDLFPVPGRQIGILPDGSPKRGAVERYFASVNDNAEFMLVQHLNFKRLLAPISFFFEEELPEN
ncbi:MAG: DUF4340 domain-containing protein [Bacteroidota bacterium]